MTANQEERPIPLLELTDEEMDAIIQALWTGHQATITRSDEGEMLLQGNVQQLCSFLLNVGQNDLGVAELLAERVVADGAGFRFLATLFNPPPHFPRGDTS